MGVGCHAAIMLGVPGADNNVVANILLLSDAGLNFSKRYVKSPTYSVSCATSRDRPRFLREKHQVDPQTQGGVGEQLIELVRQVLGAGSPMPEPVPLDAQLSDLGISSLKMVNLMLAVELEFNLAIAQSDITPENFHSLSSIKDLIVRTLAAQRA
jgi:acyl carrier protein